MHPRLIGDVQSGPSGPLPKKRFPLATPDNQDDLDEMSISGTEGNSEPVDTTYSMIVSCGVQMTA